MNKKIVFIDDSDIALIVEAVKSRINRNPELDCQVECKVFNPVNERFANSAGEINFQKSLSALINEEFTSKVDIVACDFNLHENDKTLTFQIINEIRTINKSCAIIIYSGGLVRSLLGIFNTLGNTQGEKMFYLALSSNISKFIGNRNRISEHIEELLKSPSIELEIDEFLSAIEPFVVSHGYHELKTKKLSDVASEIRKGSNLGKKYVREIIERGVSHMINLNEI